MSTVITPFQGTDSFSTATFNNRISQINTGFSYISNPNLLDNWYFGNPVDQRGGYVVPPGTPYYISGESTVSGNTTAYYKVAYWSGTAGQSNAVFYIDGVGCVCDKAYPVRGYTGSGYGIDRWKANNPYTVLIKDGYLQLISGVQNGFYSQYLDGIFAKLPGKTVTMSVLAEVISGEAYLNVIDGNSASKKITNGLTSVTKTIISAPTEDIAVIYATEGAVINVYAVKLELGTIQTLAHQENGVWQLNEIPDYGEQLARCQMRQIVLDATPGFAVGRCVKASDTIGHLMIPVPCSFGNGNVAVVTTGDFRNVGYNVYADIPSSALSTTGRVVGGMCVIDINANVVGDGMLDSGSSGRIILDRNL